MQANKNIPGVINRALVVEGNNLRNYIIQSMRDTQRATWFRKVTKSGQIHNPSMPGSQPAIDKGGLVRSIMYDVENNQLKVGSIAGTCVAKGERSYAEILETSKNTKMKRPWLEPAVKANEDRIYKNIEVAIKKGIGL